MGGVKATTKHDKSTSELTIWRPLPSSISPKGRASAEDFGESHYCNGNQVDPVAFGRETKLLPLPLPKPTIVESNLALPGGQVYS